MLLAWESTPKSLVDYAVNDLPEEHSMLHFHEEALLRSPALNINSSRSVRDPQADTYTVEHYSIYESHTDVWAYFRGYQTAIFSRDAQRWSDGIIDGLRACLKNSAGATLSVLAAKRGDPESVMNIVNMLYSLGVKNIRVTLVNERDGIVDVSAMPVGFKTFVRLDNPDVLMLLMTYGVLHGSGSGKLTNINQVADMVNESGLKDYLPAKKGKRTANAIYKALQRASKDMAACDLLTYSTKGRRDEYAITSLGQCYLSIVKQLKDELCEDAKRLLTDASKITKGVSEYRRKPSRVL